MNILLWIYLIGLFMSTFVIVIYSFFIFLDYKKKKIISNNLSKIGLVFLNNKIYHYDKVPSDLNEPKSEVIGFLIFPFFSWIGVILFLVFLKENLKLKKISYLDKTNLSQEQVMEQFFLMVHNDIELLSEDNIWGSLIRNKDLEKQKNLLKNWLKMIGISNKYLSLEIVDKYSIEKLRIKSKLDKQIFSTNRSEDGLDSTYKVYEFKIENNRIYIKVLDLVYSSAGDEDKIYIENGILLKSNLINNMNSYSHIKKPDQKAQKLIIENYEKLLNWQDPSIILEIFIMKNFPEIWTETQIYSRISQLIETIQVGVTISNIELSKFGFIKGKNGKIESLPGINKEESSRRYRDEIEKIFIFLEKNYPIGLNLDQEDVNNLKNNLNKIVEAPLDSSLTINE